MVFVVETARNLTNQTNMDISIQHYLKHMSKLADQFNPHTYQETTRQRLYLKDIDCPDEWHKLLRDLLPPNVFYLNESTADGPDPGRRGSGAGVGPAGDLMSSLPAPMRAENLMCYIGHEGTYTPAHREMCASLGQNIMVETSGDGQDLWGKQEKPGSSVWFMTETKDRYLVSEYWMSILGHDIEVESHFAQINAWKHAPFTTYVVDQRAGDFILIPPLAPHQVWNRGSRTMKVAWNRTTIETLEMALDEALPRARMVCRDEQYKNKAIVYHTMQKYANLLTQVSGSRKPEWSDAATAAAQTDRKVLQLQKDFRSLFKLFTDILLSEMFSPGLPKEKHVQFLRFDSNVTCAYCRCNIFNRFLTCPTCVYELGPEDAYDICMECFAMGRSCACVSKFKWVEQWEWKKLAIEHDTWRRMIIDMDGEIDQASPMPLDIARQRLGKKTLAHVCQEQLKIRSWKGIKAPQKGRMGEHRRDADEAEDSGDDEDSARRKRSRKRKRRSQAASKNIINCHICKHRELDGKLVHCKCGTAYCYGVLFRAFDLMPLEVMEKPDWKCPKCLKICSCAQCRKAPGTRPYVPMGTLVGHDTKKVADPRSFESLVDFSRSNLNWINQGPDNDVGHPYETVRLRRLKEAAEREKAKEVTLDSTLADQNEARTQLGGGSTQDTIPSFETGGSGELAVDPNLTPLVDAVMEEAECRYRDHGNSHQPALRGSGPCAPRGDHRATTATTGLGSAFQPKAPASPKRDVAPIARMVPSPGSSTHDRVSRRPARSSLGNEKSAEEPELRDLSQSALEASFERTLANIQQTYAETEENDRYNIARARLLGLEKIVSSPVHPDQGKQRTARTAQQTDGPQSSPSVVSGHSTTSDSMGLEQLAASSLSRTKSPAKAKSAVQIRPAGRTNSTPSSKPTAALRPSGSRYPPRSASSKDHVNEDRSESESESEWDVISVASRRGHHIGSPSGSDTHPRRSPHPSKSSIVDKVAIPANHPTKTPRKKAVLFADDYSSSSFNHDLDESDPGIEVNKRRRSATWSEAPPSKRLRLQHKPREKEDPYEAAKRHALRVAEGQSLSTDVSSDSNQVDDDGPSTESEPDPQRPSFRPARRAKIKQRPSLPSKKEDSRGTKAGAATKTRKSAAATPSGSLFARPGMSGRKIKIVSQKNATGVRQSLTLDSRSISRSSF